MATHKNHMNFVQAKQLRSQMAAVIAGESKDSPVRDEALAKMFGISYSKVRYHRDKLGIASAHKRMETK